MNFERNDVKFINAGFNDACTNFLVKFHHTDFDQLIEAIKNVKSYNEFSGAEVSKTFAKIQHLALFASFGREGSPVLYIQLRRENSEPIGCGGPIGSNEVIATFKNMKSSTPDECGANFYDRALLRFWWD